MAAVSRKTKERKDVETLDNDGILQLNEQDTEEGLNHKNLRLTTVKNPSGYGGIDMNQQMKQKQQHNRIFIHKELATKVTAAHKKRTRLGFKQCDVILTKEQSVLTIIKSSFEGGNIQTQQSVFGYRIDLPFHDYKLAIKIYVNGRNGKIVEQELGCEFIRIDPGKKESIFKAINEIFIHIKQSSK